jgi:hypothetical protein
LPDQRGELPRRPPTRQFGVDGATLLNENRTVAISLRRELQKQRTEKKRVIMTGTPRFLRLGAEESPQHPLISDD